MSLRTGWWTLGLGLIVLITVLSLIPMGPPPVQIPNGDKLNHALAYITLTWWFGQLHTPTLRARTGLVLALFGYGVAIEWAQSLTGYRSADAADLLANGVGMALGLALLRSPAGRLYAWITYMTTVSRRG